jgi:hypothetical protein
LNPGALRVSGRRIHSFERKKVCYFLQELSYELWIVHLLLLHVREVPGSNLGSETGYPG